MFTPQTVPTSETAQQDDDLAPPRCADSGSTSSLPGGGTLVPGECVGAYRVVRKLGSGGYGQVYEAVDEGINKRVALKVLHPRFEHDERSMQRLQDEARSINRIGHPGLVDVIASGQLPGGMPFIVMEFLEGLSLDQKLRDGPLHPAVLLPIARQLAETLAAAHRRGVVHRDLKPQNVMLVSGRYGAEPAVVKVIDFGIAKLMDDTASRRGWETSTGAIFGSLPYMSPEQCRDSGAVDPQTDVYALGVVFYEALAGTRPFNAEEPKELCRQHQEMSAPPLAMRAPKVPRRLARLVNRMLAKSALQRPTMAQVASELQALERTGMHLWRPQIAWVGVTFLAAAVLWLCLNILSAVLRTDHRAPVEPYRSSPTTKLTPLVEPATPLQPPAAPPEVEKGQAQVETTATPPPGPKRPIKPRKPLPKKNGRYDLPTGSDWIHEWIP